ncbi:CDP-glycerol glycerophosphotransferase, partial [Stenotrophomonas maltophilia]
GVDRFLNPPILEQVGPRCRRGAEIVRYADAIHPYRDGLSSERVIAATEDFLSGEMGALRRKPLGSWVRDLQIRRDLGYWGPSQR